MDSISTSTFPTGPGRLAAKSFATRIRRRH